MGINRESRRRLFCILYISVELFWQSVGILPKSQIALFFATGPSPPSVNSTGFLESTDKKNRKEECLCRFSHGPNTHVEVRISGKGQSLLKAWTNSLGTWIKEDGSRRVGGGPGPRGASWYKARSGALRWPRPGPRFTASARKNVDPPTDILIWSIIIWNPTTCG